MSPRAGSSASALLQEAGKVLERSRADRLAWIDRREAIARSAPVRQSLVQVRAAVERALSAQVATDLAHDRLEGSVQAAARATAAQSVQNSAPNRPGTALDRMHRESGERAIAAFDLLLDAARVRVAHARLRLAAVLGPADNPGLLKLAGRLTRTAANVGVNFTPAGNAIAIAQGVQQAHDQLRTHMAKAQPVEVEVADAWFRLVDVLLDELTGCEREHAEVAERLRQELAFTAGT